jgi:hypothetical protein
MAREVVNSHVVAGGRVGGSVDSGCMTEWMRANGLWTAADDAAVVARYGLHAWDDHWYCCRLQPWKRPRCPISKSVRGDV